MSSPLSAPPSQLPVDAPVVTFLPPSSPPLADGTAPLPSGDITTPPPPTVDTTTPPPLADGAAPLPSGDITTPPPPVDGNTPAPFGDTGTPPPPLPKIAPVSSPQYPPNHSAEVLPPAIPPTSSSPPPPPVIPITSSPPFTGLVISPSPPPDDYVSPSTPTVNSPPLPAELPIPSITSSPPLPTIPSLPTTAPPPLAGPLYPSLPGSPLTPPLIPETSAPPLTSPHSPQTSPLEPPIGPSTVLPPPPPAWPVYSPPQPEPTLVGPVPPATLSSSLPLPSLNGGSLPVRSKQSHNSAGIVLGCFIGGVFVLFLLGLLCIRYRRSRTRYPTKAEDYYKPQILISKGNSIEALQPRQSGSLPNASIIAVQTKTSSLSTPSIGTRDSHPLIAGYENALPPQHHHIAPGLSRGNFSYRELVEATNCFSGSNLLGEGGFGYVHKGVLPSGKEVAVKQLKQGSRQGEREFQTEVDVISQVHHKHLVTLIGYCISGPARLLVYEFVPNSTLEFHLHETGQAVMEWTTRLKIAIRSAKGLSYLHEDCNPIIIHRDIKASNILLDHEFNAKVSDFGLAKSFSNASGNTRITHISTQVVGTFGYLAPEYASSGKVTEKSDVYSFGVVLLELITGRPPITAMKSITNQGLVVWARPLLTQALEERKFDSLVDPRLGRNYNPDQMASMIACAAACVRHSSWLRPQMSQIVHALEGDTSVKDLNQVILQPGQSTNLGFLNSSISSTDQHKNEVNSTNRTPYSWQFGISGYTATTSEYGIDPSSSSSETTSR